MKSVKTVAVWLIVSGGEFKGKVLLQQRASTDQFHPYICQSTWGGKIESGEKLEDDLTRSDIIVRGAVKELGARFADSYFYAPYVLVFLGRENFSRGGVRFIVYNFIGSITQEQLDLVKLHAGAMRKFIAIGSNDLASLKVTTDPQVDPEKQIVLFPDQHRVLRRLFYLAEVLKHLIKHLSF